MRANRIWLGLAAIAAIGGVVGTGCSGTAPSKDGDCAVGSASCACTAGGGCDDGLTCLSAVCVDTTGGSGSGGATGGGGGSSGGTGGSAGGTTTGTGGTASGTGGATGGTGGVGGTMTDPQIEAACTSFSDAYCQKLETCDPADLQRRFGDKETCKARSMKSCVPYRTLPGTSETAEKTIACAGVLSSSTCAEWINDFNAVLSVCLPQPGLLANGSACASNRQCQTKMCVAKEGATCGVCGPAHGPGESCTYSGDCLDEIPCINGTCVKPGALGSLCSMNAQCAGSLVCKASACAKPAELGESCTTNTCNSYSWLFCGSNARCQAYRFAAPGETCNNSIGLICDHGATCRVAADAGTSTGTCVLPAADGASCNATSGPGCLEYADCVNGRCQLPNPLSCK